MSESTFPFGAAAETEPALDEAPEAESRKPLIAVGALVAALVLGAGGFLLLNGGDDAEELALTIPKRPDAAATAAAPEAIAVIPAASTDAVGRNPFKARYIEPVAAAAPTGAGDGADESAVMDATPEEQAMVVRLSAPDLTSFGSSQPVAPAAAATKAPATAPTTAPTTGTPAPAPAPAVEDDGMRYPVTLQSIDVTAPGDGAMAVQFGYSEEDFQVLLGKSFGRFQHLRVVQIVREGEQSGVMLQIGDGSPFYVAVNETVYVL